MLTVWPTGLDPFVCSTDSFLVDVSLSLATLSSDGSSQVFTWLILWETALREHGEIMQHDVVWTHGGSRVARYLPEHDLKLLNVTHFSVQAFHCPQNYRETYVVLSVVMHVAVHPTRTPLYIRTQRFQRFLFLFCLSVLGRAELGLRSNIVETYVMPSAVLHVAVEKNIVLTIAQVGLSRLAILLFVLVVDHAEGHSLMETGKLRILLRLSVLPDRNIITVGAKRFRCGSVDPVPDLRAPRR